MAQHFTLPSHWRSPPFFFLSFSFLPFLSFLCSPLLFFFLFLFSKGLFSELKGKTIAQTRAGAASQLCVRMCVEAWVFTVCIKCPIQVGPRMTGDYILNWRNWPGDHSLRNEEGDTGKTEAWQSPYLTGFGGFWECLHISCLSEQLHKVLFESLFTEPSHRDSLFETTNAICTEKAVPWLFYWRLFTHVLPLETGSSIRGEKCKWNLPPPFFFTLM